MRDARSQRGFTLIELMVVIATIGVISAIALPHITNTLKRARFVEAVTTVAAIERSLVEFYNRNDRYPTDAGVQNPVGPGGGPREMTPTAPGWLQLGYKPEGSYRFRYAFKATPDGRRVEIRAWGDTDNDGIEGRLVRVLENGYRADLDTLIDE